MLLTQPPRGFELTEFENRTARLQKLMHERKLDAVLLTTEPNVRYITGFFTQFWHSPTRPWFCLVPAEGKPIAVIPGIGAAGMAATWIDDIRTWQSPCPEDDGISLLTQAIKELPSKFGRVGMTLGPESHLRMPANNFARLSKEISPLEMVDCVQMVHYLRSVKSEAEIAKIHYACQLASDAYEALPGKCSVGNTEREICQKLRMDMLARGADNSPFLVGGSNEGGYDDIIMGPKDKATKAGDVMIIDTGTVYDGYFCDFDRNYAFGHIKDDTKRAHEVVWEATEAGFKAARAGATTTDLYNAMWSVMEAGGALGNDVGRLGHGLGIELTEWPSNTDSDMTVLEPGMVMTLEPGMLFAPGRMLVHEENIVIREDGAELLTKRAPKEMWMIS
jgi:Xaa-Pro dipeptidase